MICQGHVLAFDSRLPKSGSDASGRHTGDLSDLVWLALSLESGVLHSLAHALHPCDL